MAADPFAPGGELFELFHSNKGNNDHGLKIDNKLLIDLDQLILRPKIFNSSHSIVFEGLYKSEPVAIEVIKPDNVIKVIKPDKLPALNSKGKDKFEREVTVHSRARNDNIVKQMISSDLLKQFIGASVEPALMIITELMRGGTLLKYLLGMRPNCPDLELSLHFAKGISEAMIYLHAKGIIHRDLKPSNILLSEDKNKVKIADFGLAREEIIGDMSTEAGTYRWMAPEMFNLNGKGNKKRYDHKVDVYSFSIVLWELLTNRTPFKGRSSITAAYAAAINLRPSTNNVPQEIVPLLESCWAEDMADRPEFIQIKHFLENFRHCLRPIETTPPRMPEMERPTESNVPRNRNSQCTDHPMEKHKENNRKTRKPCSRCFSCFRACSDKLKELLFLGKQKVL